MGAGGKPGKTFIGRVLLAFANILVIKAESEDVNYFKANKDYAFDAQEAEEKKDDASAVAGGNS